MTELVLVGEAWGEQEEQEHAPFVGPTGWLLTQLLAQVGISRKDLYITNVFNLRPKPSNDIRNLCGSKDQGIPNLPPLQRSKYVLKKYATELDRLYEEIKRENPNLIVALGATAAWAFLHTIGIKNIRGATTSTHDRVSKILGRDYKVLPTYHPAAIARQYELRPVFLSDMDKAKRESNFPEVVRPKRDIWIYPSLDDLAKFEQLYINPAEKLAADIETIGNQITCIGFAPNEHIGIVIPFYSVSRPDKNYWPTAEAELKAWCFVRRWLSKKPTIFQNGMYDIQFLWRSYGIPVPKAAEDTMLMHHAWQPEMEKGLGFLATLYTDEASWKFMRKGLKHD